MIDQEGSQKAAAAKLGVSAAYLNDVLQGNRKIGKKILGALGLEVQFGFVNKKVNGK